MRRAIVIPTYWSRVKGEYREGDLVFDHPTPLDEEGTLQRCLDSLNRLKGTFDLILIAVPTNYDIRKDLEIKLMAMISRLNLRYRVIAIFPSTMDGINERLEEDGQNWIFSLRGYSQVRNACILIPSILGYEIFILLDDDEVVRDEDFLDRAAENLGAMFQGRKIVSKAGVYLQHDGSPYFKDKEAWWRYFLNGKKAMNEAFKLTELGERFVDTPFAFGGNMSISREVIEKGIPFDPNVPRGEDIDFLVNIKTEGLAFVLDTTLRILHLPPKSYNPSWIKLRQDASRFLYMRSKLLKLKRLNVKRKIEPGDLKPYPGPFLDWTLKSRIFLTGILLAIDYAFKLKFGDSREALATIKLIFKNYGKLVSEYFRFKENWEKVAPKLINRPDLSKIILKKG